MSTIKPVIILLAEDNPADSRLIERNLEKARVYNELYIVEDGVEAMDYLNREGKYSDPKSSPRPDIFLLDINMPKMDGKQVLEKMKSNPKLKNIPVIVLTTSNHERDIIDSYNLGVNAYLRKPLNIEEFREMIHQFENFWMMWVVLPPTQE